MKSSDLRESNAMRDAVDAEGLAGELRAAIEGEVRFGMGDRALYAQTGSNYRQLPIGVVIPKTVDDVVATVALCREHGAPIVGRGGGTSLAGQTVNFAVVIDYSKYLNRVLEIDPDQRLARVQPGVVLDRLREQAEQYGLTFGPDPSTHTHCTLGGMIGNNSCGVRSIMAQFYGPGPRTSDNVHELEILTYRGERLRVGQAGHGVPGELAAKLQGLVDRYGDLVRERYPKIPRRVSGYNLDDLLPENGFHVARSLSGTEGTCVTMLEATVHLVESPPCRSLIVLGYEDAAVAADNVPLVLEHKPLGLEGIDEQLITDMTMLGQHQHDLSQLPDGRGYLVIEVGGETKEEADERGREIIRDAETNGSGLKGTKLYDDPKSEEHIWGVREAGLGATAFLPGKADTYEGWEDSAVPPERLGDYLRELKQLTDSYGYESAMYGHYGNGCIHARWNFDLHTQEGIAKWRRFLDDAADLVVAFGGSISGEHGDGQSKAELLPKMFGDELIEAFREFKSIWDPDWKMNPGKVVDPNPITSHLKLGADYEPKPVKTWFAYPDDGGSFAHATVRCVGIGNCRKAKGGVMCPSYMVTSEEKDATRGRAHLLWEMLNNPEIELWQSDAVMDALDLCLSCKGCTNECPVNVDMPTLKAEFLAHHYEHKPRPRHAYAFGHIDKWARLASIAPGLANFFTQTPLLATGAKAVAGVDRRRQMPAFAPATFQSWFAGREPRNVGARRVLLWPDTFTNHFEPQVGIAAVEELEAAGLHVTLPRGKVCCGRPLYDYGFLRTAQRYLRRMLDTLREEIRAGVPVVGLEPSCVAVFKDELVKMLPTDEDAKRLAKQTFHLAEYLGNHLGGYTPPSLDRHVLLHGHCHGKATGAFDPEQKLLERMAVEVKAPESGCCGMAGAWGYEQGHYDVSEACAERVLLPAVRDAAPQTVIVASGFSCRSQIEQLGPGRTALHVAQALRLARTGHMPEPPSPSGRAARVAAVSGFGAGLAAAGIARRRR